MTNKSNQKEKYLEFLKLFNETLSEPLWDDSVFLQAIRKKLTELRDQFKEDAQLSDEDLEQLSQVQTKHLIKNSAQTQGYKEVYIVLYNSDGTTVSKWESLLNSIEMQAINRPTYIDEESAKAVLRAASQKFNEAYVSIFVKETDILTSSHLVDRYGHQLVALRDGAIKKENIFHFVHKSGQYEFENNKLVWQEDVSSL